MRIKSLHPAAGWRAVYVVANGEARIAPVVFFALIEVIDVGFPREESSVSMRVVPLVADDHDFARELVAADVLGSYALLGPDEIAEPGWIKQLTKRTKR